MEDQLQKLSKEYIGDVMCDAWMKELLALFTQSVEEIISPDEPIEEQEVEVGPEGGRVYDVTEDISKWRNFLRAEQRARLATLIKQ